MEHSLAVSILEAINKDSKVFQGVLVSHDCYPINQKRKNVAHLLISIADGLLDHPKQTDLFENAPRSEDQGKLVECSACHTMQPDGGPGQWCTACGAGPMPTNFPLTAKACHQAINAVLDEKGESIELAEFETWTAAELESGIAWAKKLAECEAGEIEPAMPIHIKELLLVSSEITVADVQEALQVAFQGLLPDHVIGDWTPSDRHEAFSYLIRSTRDPFNKEIQQPEFLKNAWEAEGERLAAAATDLAKQMDSGELPEKFRPPFINSDGTMTVDVDTRLKDVRQDTFTAEDCRTALMYDDNNQYLQKTVRSAIESKLRRLEKEAEKAPAETVTQ